MAPINRRVKCRSSSPRPLRVGEAQRRGQYPHCFPKQTQHHSGRWWRELSYRLEATRPCPPVPPSPSVPMTSSYQTCPLKSGTRTRCPFSSSSCEIVGESQQQHHHRRGGGDGDSGVTTSGALDLRRRVRWCGPLSAVCRLEQERPSVNLGRIYGGASHRPGQEEVAHRKKSKSLSLDLNKDGAALCTISPPRSKSERASKRTERKRASKAKHPQRGQEGGASVHLPRRWERAGARRAHAGNARRPPRTHGVSLLLLLLFLRCATTFGEESAARDHGRPLARPVARSDASLPRRRRRRRRATEGEVNQRRSNNKKHTQKERSRNAGSSVPGHRWIRGAVAPVSPCRRHGASLRESASESAGGTALHVNARRACREQAGGTANASSVPSPCPAWTERLERSGACKAACGAVRRSTSARGHAVAPLGQNPPWDFRENSFRSFRQENAALAVTIVAAAATAQ
ncbi:unnamed protein product [Lampetra fluviatilis]